MERDVYWEWLCSLVQESEPVKIDPERVSCQCGYSFYPSLFQKIMMLIHDGVYVKTCPRCGSKMKLFMSYHVNCIERENVDKIGLWRRS